MTENQDNERIIALQSEIFHLKKTITRLESEHEDLDNENEDLCELVNMLLNNLHKTMQRIKLHGSIASNEMMELFSESFEVALNMIDSMNNDIISDEVV